LPPAQPQCRSLTVAQSALVAGSDEIKVGLIGCGGRGSGAASQALSTKQEGIVLHAMADAFKDRSILPTAISATPSTLRR
jgi:predicted homoserine dehydrogenase-like protein